MKNFSLRKIIRRTLLEERKRKGIKKFTLTKSNFSPVVQKLSRISDIPYKTLETEFKSILNNH